MTSPPDATSRDAAPLTEAAEWHVPLPAPADPIAAWLDLIEVVESLCPSWPERAPTEAGDFRL